MSLQHALEGCQCASESDATAFGNESDLQLALELGVDVPLPPKPAKPQGLRMFVAELRQPLLGPRLRTGEIWHLLSSDGKRFEPATLSLYANGLLIQPCDESSPSKRPLISLSWSPFSLVQACRLHTVEADASRPWLRLFKVSVFHHDTAHLFATQGENADSERARWVADIARALRLLTQSLFPAFSICADPVRGRGWTATRLLAGYMLMCEKEAVSVVYCELHTHWDGVAKFVAYEEENCDSPVMHISMRVDTSITERVGIDCSCFSVDGHHFSTRTYAEKSLWLRAISNVKVKLRHGAANPNAIELVHYRSSIIECAKGVGQCPANGALPKALLPHRGQPQMQLPGAVLGSMDGRPSNGNGFHRQESQEPARNDSSEGEDEPDTDPALPPPEPSNHSQLEHWSPGFEPARETSRSSNASLFGPKFAPPQAPIDQGMPLSPMADGDEDVPAPDTCVTNGDNDVNSGSDLEGQDRNTVGGSRPDTRDSSMTREAPQDNIEEGIGADSEDEASGSPRRDGGEDSENEDLEDGDGASSSAGSSGALPLKTEEPSPEQQRLENEQRLLKQRLLEKRSNGKAPSDAVPAPRAASVPSPTVKPSVRSKADKSQRLRQQIGQRPEMLGAWSEEPEAPAGPGLPPCQPVQVPDAGSASLQSFDSPSSSRKRSCDASRALKIARNVSATLSSSPLPEDPADGNVLACREAASPSTVMEEAKKVPPLRNEITCWLGLCGRGVRLLLISAPPV